MRSGVGNDRVLLFRSGMSSHSTGRRVSAPRGCAFRRCQANTGDVLVLDHRLRSCNQTCPVARCVAAYNRFEISYTLLKLEDYDLGIRSQPQRRSPGSCSARSENLHPPDLA